jgi:hypothetical protein
MCISTLSLTLELDGVGCQHHAQAVLPLHPLPGNELVRNCIGGWVGPRAGLDGCGKSRLHP